MLLRRGGGGGGGVELQKVDFFIDYDDYDRAGS